MTLSNESLRKKRSARLAAVQGIYHFTVSEQKKSAEKLHKLMMDQWKDSINSRDDEWPSNIMPDSALLQDVLSGVLEYDEDIKEALGLVLKENWKPERMDPVVLAILRCAIYELKHRTDTTSAIILDEYVTIGSGFADKPELGFIHSALQTLATKLRPAS